MSEITPGVSKPIDLRVERNKYLRGLRAKVDVAYSRRSEQNWNEDLTATKESVDKQRKQQQEMLGLPDTHVLSSEFSKKPSTVSVENSHDYRDLLKISFEKMVSEGVYDDSDVPESIDAILKHEHQHHVPALGIEGVKVRFNVTFFEDKALGDIGFIPSVSLAGDIPLGVIRQMAHAAEDKGEGDKILTEE